MYTQYNYREVIEVNSHGYMYRCAMHMYIHVYT